MANESRKSRALRQQNPGMASTGRVDPAAGARARRAAAGEQAAGLRYRQGLRVQDDGSLEVHTDATLRVDQRQQLGVRNKFDTPTKDTQAANKAYVDAQLARFGTAYRVQTDLAFDQLYSNPTGLITVPVVAGPGTTAVTSELDLGNLLASGSDGISLKGGHSYIIRGGLSAISGNNNYHEGRLIAAVKNATSGVLTILLWRTVRTSQQNRTHWTVEAVYTATEDVEAVLLYEWLQTGSFRLAFPLLSAQRVAPYDEDNGPLPLPPLPDGFAAISYNELTAVAWTDDLSLWGNGLPDSDTFTWTFDEYGPTYLTYSGAYGSPISHRFMDGGTHTVELTASGPSGSDTATVDVVVQDVVETQNILASVGILDATGFDDLPANVASQSVSSIAAPDGTLTAIETVATSPTVQPVIRALLFKTTGTYTQIGDLWQDGLAWTCAIYAYMGQANAERITLQVRTLTTAGVSSDVVTVVVVDGSVLSFSSNSTGSVAYSAERNARVEAVGDTGWYRIEVTLQDYARTCDRIYLEIYGTSSSAYDRYITWNPTLRYGDWVSRGKNWGASDPRDFAFTPDTALSSIVAPDGTLSAVDITYTSSPYQGIWREQITAGIPGSGLYVWSFYIRETDYATGTAGLNENRLNLRFELFVGSTPVVSRRSDLNLLSGSVALDSPANFTVANIEAVGSDGWHKVTVGYSYDGSSGAISTAYIGIYHPYLPNPTQTHTVWNPRLTVGNPADMLDYFVSGPQNLLGDGSDYSGWTAGVH